MILFKIDNDGDFDFKNVIIRKMRARGFFNKGFHQYHF